MPDIEGLTIGEEFAARWIARNYRTYAERGKPEELFGEISRAVDDYVEQQQKQLLSKLRTVALKTVDGSKDNGEVTFDSSGFLQYQGLVNLAKLWNKSMSAVYEFPV